ncbi:cation-transporting ATPase [Streptomyces regensis]|nr:cation-transporting ATPase [Streptomyces regensis]
MERKLNKLDGVSASVTEEVGELAGVRGVDVDLDSGAVTVTSDDELSTDAVRAAVEEAGYTLSV